MGWEHPLEKEMAQTEEPGWKIPMDRGAWQATVHGAAKSRTLGDSTHTHTQYM